MRTKNKRLEGSSVHEHLMKLEVGQDVHSRGVGKMIQQILEGALSCDNALNEKTQYCNHSKSAILDLFELEGLQRRLVLAKAQDIEEGSPGIGGIARACEYGIYQLLRKLLTSHFSSPQQIIKNVR